MAGAGAFCNGKRIAVNRITDYRGGLVTTNQPPFITQQPSAIGMASASLAAVLPEVMAVRNFGPTSLQLAFVASGKVDAFWEFGDDGVNCLGGSLLVREAGGRATDVGGQPYGIRACSSIVAAPPPVHESLRATLAKL